jgi:thiol-disulfide isomerase/thioredoxin
VALTASIGRRHRRAFVACGMLLAVIIAAQHRVCAAERFTPFTLQTLEGDTRTLPQLLGKATLVVFFFPTCPYCNAALPEIQKIHDAYKDRGLSVVWINVVAKEEPLIDAWQTAHGFTVLVLRGTESIVRDYRLTMTPTNVLLDAEGRVIAKRAGYRKGDEHILTRQIQQALGLARSGGHT